MQFEKKPETDLISLRFGQAVKDHRELRGWKQSDLAERLSEALGKAFATTTVTRLERGTRPTPISEVYVIAEVLGVSPTSLLPQADALQQLPPILWRKAHGLEDQLERAERELRNIRRSMDLNASDMAAVSDVLHFVAEGQSHNTDGDEIALSLYRTLQVLTALDMRVPIPDLFESLNLSTKWQEEYARRYADIDPIDIEHKAWEEGTDRETIELQLWADMIVEVFLEANDLSRSDASS